MTTLTLPLPSGRAGRGYRRSRIFDLGIHVVAGIRDGLRMLRHYKSLAYKTDVELARIGVRRENIPHEVVSRH